LLRGGSRVRVFRFGPPRTVPGGPILAKDQRGEANRSGHVREVQTSKARPCALDLSTVRETLAYVHDDMRRAPGLERAAAALAAALAEIELAERGATAPARRQGPARFLSRRALR
jgi:hypothetical protein